MNYPREYILFVERLVRGLPERRRELDSIDCTIVAMSHMPTVSEDKIKMESRGASEPERIVMIKERHPLYRWLSGHIASIENALSLLNAQERDVVASFCFDDCKGWEVAEMLGVDERTAWKIKYRALHKMVPSLLTELVPPLSWSMEPPDSRPGA